MYEKGRHSLLENLYSKPRKLDYNNRQLKYTLQRSGRSQIVFFPSLHILLSGCLLYTKEQPSASKDFLPSFWRKLIHVGGGRIKSIQNDAFLSERSELRLDSDLGNAYPFLVKSYRGRVSRGMIVDTVYRISSLL